MGGRGNVAATTVFGLFGMLVAAVAWASAEARAQTRPPAPNVCKAEVFGTGTVATVMDGRSFTLADGREIRLAGIEVPLPPAPGETGTTAEAGLAASRTSHAALAAMVAGQSVELRQTRDAAPDRYGRILALAYVNRDGALVSVANAMLAGGFARVSAQVGGDKACAAELLGKERLARDGKLGLWGEAYYAVTGAESLAELEAGRGRFTVVEGKVLSVRESGGTIYMNFGRRWSQALTVTILKRNERTFAAAGLDLRKLENRRVRVRGWVEDRSGPRIEATRPEQIEIAERN
jgi:endonuclease YncB( thermonuclease family)